MPPAIDRLYTLEDAHTHRFGLTEQAWKDLLGRRFWILGGGTGYGAAVASALSQAGAHTIISSRRAAVLAQTQAHINSLNGPGTTHAEVVDVTDDTSIDAVARKLQASGPIDGIFVAAALPNPQAGPTPLQALECAVWDRLMNTNLRGPWLATRALLPHFSDRGYGRAVLVSSTAGWHTTPGFGPYNLSKTSLNALAMNLAAETQAAQPDADIKITILDPSEAKTEMNKGSDVSAHVVIPMALKLLVGGDDIKTGNAYHRDGRCLPTSFTAPPPVIETATPPPSLKARIVRKLITILSG